MKPWISATAVAGVIACGLFGIWAAASSPWAESQITHAVGLTGVVSFALAAVAMLRHSWARLPLAGACVLSALLIDAGFLTEYDPSAMTLLGHLFLEVLLVVAGSIAAFVTLLDVLTKPSKSSDPIQRIG